MADLKTSDSTAENVSLYILSGGSGALGEQLSRTVLAQFEGEQVELHVFPKVYRESQLDYILSQAEADQALVVCTLVDPMLADYAAARVQELGLRTIDIVKDLIDYLSVRLDKKPLGKPGLYRELHTSYFDRIEAINYSINHDDGKNPIGWGNAEIVLVGVSRVGKTPLSLYLSMLGWKVANIPIVPGIPLDPSLNTVDKRKVVGLKIEPGELLAHRRFRQGGLGTGGNKSDYVDPMKIFEETKSIESMMRRRGYPMVDTTDKPIETSASEVIKIVQRKMRRKKASNPEGEQFDD